MGSLLGELIAWMADALVDCFRMPKFRRGRTTTSTDVTACTRSTMQYFKLGSNGAWGQRSTSLPNLASSAPTSSSMRRSEGLSLSNELNPEPTCWRDSGISIAEQAIMRRVAEQFPSGAYAAFVRMMDQGEAERRGRMSEPTEEEQRDPDYCWTHGKIEKKEEEE